MIWFVGGYGFCTYVKTLAFATNCPCLQIGSPNLWESSSWRQALGFEASGQMFKEGSRFQGLICSKALRSFAGFYNLPWTCVCFTFCMFLAFWVFIPGRWRFAFLLLHCLMRVDNVGFVRVRSQSWSPRTCPSSIILLQSQNTLVIVNEALQNLGACKRHSSTTQQPTT